MHFFTIFSEFETSLVFKFLYRILKNNKISENFPILEETKREILEDVMDLENAKKVLESHSAWDDKYHSKTVNTLELPTSEIIWAKAAIAIK